jgi:hypothetical protein
MILIFESILVKKITLITHGVNAPVVTSSPLGRCRKVMVQYHFHGASGRRTCANRAVLLKSA